MWTGRKVMTLKLPRLSEAGFRREAQGLWSQVLERARPLRLARAFAQTGSRWLCVDPFHRLSGVDGSLPLWRYHPEAPEEIGACLRVVAKRGGFDGVWLLDLMRLGGLWSARGVDHHLAKPLGKLRRAGIGTARVEVLDWPGAEDERLWPIERMLKGRQRAPGRQASGPSGRS